MGFSFQFFFKIMFHVIQVIVAKWTFHSRCHTSNNVASAAKYFTQSINFLPKKLISSGRYDLVPASSGRKTAAAVATNSPINRVKVRTNRKRPKIDTFRHISPVSFIQINLT